MKSISSLAAVSTLLASSVTAGAQNYYTVDVANDALYTINVTTGAATYVGPLGVDVDGVDLSWHQNALYAKSYSIVNGNRVYQIVTNGAWAGYAIPGAVANGGGYQGAEFAGLGSGGTALFASYSNKPLGDLYSDQFATVNPQTGALGPPTSLGFDADAVGAVGGQFWAVDIVAPGLGCNVFRGIAAPTVFVGQMSYDTTLATNPVDMEIFSANQLTSVGQTGKNLVRIFMATGQRGTVTPITGIPANGFMKGLAYQPPCAFQYYVIR